MDSFKARLANVPMMLFIGNNDVLVAPKDFEYLKAVIPLESTTIKYIEDYNHLDYMWARDANEYINNDVLSFFEMHAPSPFIQ